MSEKVPLRAVLVALSGRHTDPHNFRPKRRQDGTENPMECRHCGGVPAAAVHNVPPITELPHKFKALWSQALVDAGAPTTCRRCGKPRSDQLHRFRGLAKEPAISALLAKSGKRSPDKGGIAALGNASPRIEGTASESHAGRKGKVRLRFPSLASAPPELVDVVAFAIRGAVRSFIDAHGAGIPKSVRGMMIGSITKRALNQLCSADGVRRLRDSLNGKD